MHLKIFKKSDLIFFRIQSLFRVNYYEKQKTIGTSDQFILRLSNMSGSFLPLIQRDFRVIQKLTVNNLCKPFNDASVIPFSTSS